MWDQGRSSALGDAHVTEAAASPVWRHNCKAHHSVCGGFGDEHCQQPGDGAISVCPIPSPCLPGDDALFLPTFPRPSQTGHPVHSAVFSFVICFIWMAPPLPNTISICFPAANVSEIAIAISYLFYPVLYFCHHTVFIKGRDQKPVARVGICAGLLDSLIILSVPCRTSSFPFIWPWPPWWPLLSQGLLPRAARLKRKNRTRLRPVFSLNQAHLFQAEKMIKNMVNTENKVVKATD